MVFQRSRFLIDGEQFQQNTSIRFGVSERLQLGASMPLVVQGGGVFDSTIEAVHRGLGVGQSYRDAYPRSRINASYEPYGGAYGLLDGDAVTTWLRSFDVRTYPRVPYDPPYPMNTGIVRPEPPLPDWYAALLRRDAVGYLEAVQGRRNPGAPGNPGSYEIISVSGQDRVAAGNPRLFAQGILWRGAWVDEVSLGVQLKAPMHAVSLLSTPGWDGSVSLNVRRRFGRFGLAGGASWTRYSMTRAFSISLPRDSGAFRLTLDWRSREAGTGTWFTEYVTFTRPTLAMGELSKPGEMISLGYRHEWHGLRLCYLFAENFGNYGVTPDAGLMVSAEARL